MQENYPILESVRQMKPEFHRFHKIPLTSDEFAVGRSLENTAVIPYIAISRKHCRFKKSDNNEWIIEDFSAFGIQVNGNKLKKSNTYRLSHNDVIQLDVTGEFIYRFVKAGEDEFQSPRKRIKLDPESCAEIINNVKMKFEESQSFEIKHIEEKILTTKHMQTASLLLKTQLEEDMANKVRDLESHFALQIENLKGEKNEVERQKTALEKERDCQLNVVKSEMETRISELMEQIQKHSETEAQLVNENSELKTKLLKEREDFLEELNRESTSKQEMLRQLEAKIKEQEDIRAVEKTEMENLRLAKEKELKELEEKKKLRELELEQELSELKRNLEELAKRTASEKELAEQDMKEKIEQLRKLSNEEKNKMKQLLKERAEAEKVLAEAQKEAEKSLEDVKKQVLERETQLAALAADRIQKQAEQSGQIITLLQEQLEKVKSQLQSVESEKNMLLENICDSGSVTEVASKEATLTEVGELMESELQCSICAELFVAATTLNCSHTYCKYCITMWKKKKRECPICRSTITSECRSLVLDSFIEKMVQNLTDDMKRKREKMLKDREELVKTMGQDDSTTSRRRSSYESFNDYDDSGDYESIESRDSLDAFEQGEGDTDDDHDRGFRNIFDHPRFDPNNSEFELTSDSDDFHDSDDDDDIDGNSAGGSASDDDGEYGSDGGEGSGSDGGEGRGSDGGSGEGSGSNDGSGEGRGSDGREGGSSNDGSGEHSGSGGGETDDDHSNGGSDNSAATADGGTTEAGEATSTSGGSGSGGRRRRRRDRSVPGRPGSYYGGYGHCFRCGARGHWAPGCPERD